MIPVEPAQPPPELNEVAAQWLARRDRGLTATEQDAYLQWLREKPEHGVAIARLEQVWRMLDPLRKWRPAHSPQPNPDLLAPRPRSRRRWPVWTAALAAAACVAFAAIFWVPRAPSPLPSQHSAAVIHPGPERMALEDGSVVELNTGARLEVNFTPLERRVHLLRGEAHFTVAKNPARPFVVSADKVAVRAVGTAFSVTLDRAAVSVLVTEGKVRLDQLSSDAGKFTDPRELSHLVAGQQAVVSMDAAGDAVLPLQVRDVTPAEVERALAWQGLRLEFVDMPLRDVVAEFNRYNVRHLVVGDAGTADILVGGNFRADNVDTFVRLLDVGFGITATPRGNDIVLSRRR